MDRNFNKRGSHSVCCVAIDGEMYSASQVERAIVPCFVVDHKTKVLLRL